MKHYKQIFKKHQNVFLDFSDKNIRQASAEKTTNVSPYNVTTKYSSKIGIRILT